MSDDTVRVLPEPLADFVSRLFAKVGCGESDARYMAECLVQTNLWGIDSHGVLRAPLYVKRFENGAMKSSPQFKIEKGQGVIEVMDADDGSGYLACRAAMERAIALAKTNMVGVVGIKRSNHCGAMMLYARLAAEEGMIGIAMSNVVPNMVVPGGVKPVTGNNPIAFAIPTFGEFPLVLDMSLSAVAGGKLLLAASRGEKIPLGWATDKHGCPTDDPQKGFKGFLLPMGGYKGFGLSLVVDILCGVLTGGAFQHQLKGMYKNPDEPSLTGQMMIVLNLAAFMPEDDMKFHMAGFIETLKASPMMEADDEMLVPGELEHRAETERRTSGIPLPRKVHDELLSVAGHLGVEPVLPLADRSLNS